MTTRLNFDFMILEQMSEGVILLNRNAQIVSFNRAAQPWIKLCQSAIAQLKRLILEDTHGRTRLPMPIDLSVGAEVETSRSPDAWLCKNGPSDYAVFVIESSARKQSLEGALAKRVTHQKIFSQIGEELRKHITATRALRINPRTKWPTTRTLLELQSERTDHTLQLISDLSLLMEREHQFSDERIALSELVENILLLQPGPDRGGAAKYTFIKDAAPHDPVFGSAAWLSYGLRVLMSDLGRGTPSESIITLTLRQHGSAVVLRGETQHAKEMEGRVDSRNLTLQMLLCRRIFELHAGLLQIETLPDSDAAVFNTQAGQVKSFTLTMSTGSPYTLDGSREGIATMQPGIQTSGS